MSQKLVDARSVGIIGKPHGIKGEVNVMLLTDYPGSISQGSLLYTDRVCTRKLKIEAIYFKKSRGRSPAVIKFSGIGDRDQAEKLRGKELFRSPDESPVLKEGEYWVDELEGCRVILADSTEVGRVEEIEVLPSNENLVIAQEGREDRIYVPLVDQYIDHIDIRGRTVILKRLPEFL